jgi:RecB family endonuclease NucS
MALFEITGNGLTAIPEESFWEAGIKERQDLQQWLRLNPGALGENLLIISEEFGDWEDSKRRIDLLAIDEDANLIVIELKRTEDGGHMDLQSIRYAAMISAMGFDDVVQAFSDYLQKTGPPGGELG